MSSLKARGYYHVNDLEAMGYRRVDSEPAAGTDDPDDTDDTADTDDPDDMVGTEDLE